MNSIPRHLTRAGNSYGVEVTSVEAMTFEYGTAGFRMADRFMPFIAFRTGVYSAMHTLLKMAETKSSVTAGVMITASHNQYTDNGIKAYAPKGTYFSAKEIAAFTHTVNLSDSSFGIYLEEEIASQVKGYEAALKDLDIRKSCIVIGYDTRRSSEHLRDFVVAGIDSLGSKFLKCIVVDRPLTTPLHHVLLRSGINFEEQNAVEYLQDYASTLGRKLKKIQGDFPVLIDCANGVGALWAEHFYRDKTSSFELINVEIKDFEKLNHGCGADYVKSNLLLPKCEQLKAGQRIASLDGDADRLMYSFKDQQDVTHVVDGDYQCYLFVRYVHEELTKLPQDEKLQFGVATTRYANGGFDNAVEKFSDKLTVLKGETGVANISRLVSGMDIGIFFESNGHGSVYFSEKAVKLFEKHQSDLREFAAFFYHPVGDALANLLAVEYILAKDNLSIEAWKNLYVTKSNILEKYLVDNISQYQLDPANPSLLKTPVLVREFSVSCMANKGIRVYVRPSGTEACLRLYVEADSMEEVDSTMTALKDLLLSVEKISKKN